MPQTPRTCGEAKRPAYALQRATDNLGFGVGGLIATTQVPGKLRGRKSEGQNTAQIFLPLSVFD
jgi:hypothetical protein